MPNTTAPSWVWKPASFQTQAWVLTNFQTQEDVITKFSNFFGVIKSLVDNEFLPSDIDVRSLVKDDIDFVVDFLVRYVK